MVRRYESFAGSIFKIFRSIQKIETEELGRYGLKSVFAHYLVVMDRYPEGITPTELCRVCDKDKAAISRALSEMEEKGLVIKPDISGYRVPIRLTEKGKEAAAFVSSRATTAVEAAGKGLSEKDRKTFYEALELISDNLEIICREGLSEE